MKKGFNNLIVAILSLFILTGLNFCVLLFPVKVVAMEMPVQSLEKPACHHQMMGRAQKQRTEKTLAGARNEKAALPCCAQHEKVDNSDLPREKNFNPLSLNPVNCEIVQACFITQYSNTSRSYLRPPKAGLLSATFKKE